MKIHKELAQKAQYSNTVIEQPDSTSLFFEKFEDKIKVLNQIEFEQDVESIINDNYDFEDGVDLRTAKKEFLLKTVIQESQGKEVKDNLGVGILLMLFNGLIASSANIGNKYLFMWNPDLNVFEQQYLRGIIIISFMLVIINVKAKRILWDSIPQGQFKILLFKALFGFTSNTI